MGSRDPVPSFGFRAEDMTPDENAAAWREAVATLFEVDELARGEPGPFRADLISYAVGSALVGVSRASGQRFRRTIETVARSGVDHIIVQLYTRGGYDGVADGRPIRVRVGDVCVLDLGRTLETCATAFENLTFVVPRPKWAAYLARCEALHGLVLPADSVMGKLIGRHLQSLIELAPTMALADCDAIIDGSVGLISACLRADLERRDMGFEGSSDMLLRIKEHIETHLGDRRLTGETIAAHFGLSRAALYRLFNPYGGVATFIRSRRLHRAFFDLTAPDAVGREIGERWHLGTEQNFNRSFKAAYGITTQMARRVALATHDGAVPRTDASSQVSHWMRNMAPRLL